jgi:hypothetical protein
MNVFKNFFNFHFLQLPMLELTSRSILLLMLCIACSVYACSAGLGCLLAVHAVLCISPSIKKFPSRSKDDALCELVLGLI